MGKYALLGARAGVDWSVAQGLSDEDLEGRLYPPAVPRGAHHLEPDYALIHQELKRAGVTLQLLWEEYARDNELAYKYTSFCIKYRAWALGLKRSMRQTHVAGDKLFVDYAGDTMPIVDATTGEIRNAQIFVAALGASSFTYACATATQTAPDWVGSIIKALEFIGGVPRLVVPDQPRALIAQPDRYEPGVGRLVEEFCEHYSVAVLPARPAHPRDKPKVEVAVQIVQRWILARLRNRRFFSLGELNRAIAELLVDLNQRPFKKLPGCRSEAFEKLDRPALRALPPTRMPIVRFKAARVNIDYHVDLDGHYYSVPHRLVRTSVELRIANATLEIFSGQQRVAVHPVSTIKGAHTTVAPSTCRRRTARTGSGRRPSSSPGANGSARPPAPSCAGRWRSGRIPSRATAPAWGCSAWRGSTASPGSKRPAPGRCRSARRRTASVGPRSSPTGLDRQQVLEGQADASTTAAARRNVRGADYYH